MPRPFLTLNADTTLSPGESTPVRFLYNTNASAYPTTALDDIYVRDDTSGGGYFTVEGVRIPDGQTIRFFRDDGRALGAYDFGFSGLSTLEYNAGPTAGTDTIVVNGYVDGLGLMHLDDSSYRINSITTEAPEPAEAGSLSIYRNQPTVTEGDSGAVPVTFTVTRTGGNDGSVSVNWQLVNVSTNSSDFTGAQSGVVSFADGSNASQTITIHVNGDTDFNDADLENFQVVLSNPSGGATIDVSSSSVDIVDDDSAPVVPGQISIVGDQHTVVEGNNGATPVTFTVTRTGGDDGPVSVNWQLVNVSTNSSDFTGAQSGVVSFADGSSASQAITIHVNGDTDFNDADLENFQVVLSNPSGGATLATSSANIDIVDDDQDVTATGFIHPVNAGLATPQLRDPDQFNISQNIGGDPFPGYVDHLGADWNGEAHINQNVSPVSSDRDRGAEINSIFDGTVVFSTATPGVSDGGWIGETVVVRHDLSDGSVYYSLYAHLQNVTVQKDDPVSRGTILGEIGDYPGQGDHLHFEIRGAEDDKLPIYSRPGWGYLSFYFDGNPQLSAAQQSDISTLRTDENGVNYFLIGNTRYYDPVQFIENRSVDPLGVQVEVGGGPALTELDDFFEMEGAGIVFALGGDDFLSGSQLNDQIFAGVGNDTVAGGFGNDQIWGETGHDTINGNKGDDTLNGGKGNDHIFAGNNNDLVNGEKGNDRIFGGNGSDTLNGNQGNDTLNGGKGQDTLEGNHGSDTLKGGKGGDHLLGGRGNDGLYGNQGNDTLDGGKGDDALIGGSGFDEFDFVANFGNDTVFGFNASDGRENINLSDVASIENFDDLSNNHMTQVKADVVIDDGNGNTITLIDTALNSLGADDFIF